MTLELTHKLFMLIKSGVETAGYVIDDEENYSFSIEDSHPYFVEIENNNTAYRLPFSDGPLPLSGFVESNGHDDYGGHIIIWLEGGLICAIEYAWVVSRPNDWPNLHRVRWGYEEM
jgi:hypothetical protein